MSNSHDQNDGTEKSCRSKATGPGGEGVDETLGKNTPENSGGPDLAAAQRFLDYLEPGGLFFFQTIDDNKVRMEKDGDRFAKGYPPSTFDKVQSTLATRNQQGAGVFVTVNALREGEKVRSSDTIGRIRAFFTDLDKVSRSHLRRFPLPPSAIITSSPGKHHAYWIVDDCEVVDHMEVQRRLAVLFGGDEKIIDPGRIMRLPGFLHQKVSLPPTGEEPRPAQPFMTTAEYNERVVYTLEEFLGYLSQAEAANNIYSFERARIEKAITLNIQAIKNAESGDRSNSLYRAVRNLFDLMKNWEDEEDLEEEAREDFVKAAMEIGLGEAEIRQVFKSAEKGDKQKKKKEKKEQERIEQVKEGKKPATNVAPPTGWPPAYQSLFDELMATCFVALDGGKALVYRRVPSEGRILYEVAARGEFKAFYENVVRPVVSGKGTKDRSLGDEFLSHPQRQSYERIVFDPKNQHNPKTDYNLWRGFGVEPKKGFKNWKRLCYHVWAVVCQRDKTLFKYVLRWMAIAVQKPEEPAYTALVLKGTEGVGKSILADAFKALFGQHGYSVSQSRHLVGNFNSHLRDCIALIAEEAFFAGDKAHIGALKALITSDTLTIEGKGRDVQTGLKNYLHVMMLSNEDWVIAAGLDSRRYVVLDVGSEKQNDFGYFSKLSEEIRSSEGQGAFLYALQNMDVSKFNPRHIPKTDALLDQKRRSLDPFQAWLYDVLTRGHIENRPRCDEAHEWHDIVLNNIAYESYTNHAARHNRRMSIVSEEQFGKLLTKYGFHRIRIRTGYWEGEEQIDRVWQPRSGDPGYDPEGKAMPRPQKWCRVFGPLDKAKELWELHTSIPIESSPSDDA